MGIMYSALCLFCCITVVLFSEGSALNCFDCSEQFPVKYDHTDCQFRVNDTFNTRQCQPHEIYCMVERSETNGVVTSFARNCADECDWGCRYNGFGVTSKRCVSCCTRDGCNTDNGAIQINANYWTSSFVVTFIVCLDLLLKRRS